METIKHRTLSIGGMICTGCEGKVAGALKEMQGVKRVEADHQNGLIDLEYDLMVVTLADIEAELEALGYPSDDGFLSKLKRGWIHYTEENERGNLNSRGSSCCSEAERIVEAAARRRP
ncbi:MAG: heavy-metal-associated domain-containing protein [Candidatus Latescibacterota bacterium]